MTHIDAQDEEMQDMKSIYIPLREIIIQLMLNYKDETVIEKMFHFVYSYIGV